MLLYLHQLYFKLWFSTVLVFLGSGHIYTKRDPNEHTLILLMHGFYVQPLEKDSSFKSGQMLFNFTINKRGRTGFYYLVGQLPTFVHWAHYHESSTDQ